MGRGSSIMIWRRRAPHAMARKKPPKTSRFPSSFQRRPNGAGSARSRQNCAVSVTVNGNAVTIPLAAFSFVLAGVDNNTTPPAAGQVAIAPPPGTTFTLPAAGGTYFFDCGPNDTVAGGNGGASPGATAAPFATVSVDAAGNISNNVAFTAPCKNGDHVILNSTNNVGVTLNSAVALATNGGALTLYAIYTTGGSFGSDSAPFPLVTLLSADPVVF